MPIGFKIGTSIASYSKVWLVIFGFLIGALTVLAEPAIHVLNNQVEEITQGLVKKKINACCFNYWSWSGNFTFNDSYYF